MKRSSLSAALLLTLATTITAAPAPLSARLQSASRVAEYDDISSQFTSFYQVSSSCPSQLTFGDYSIDERQVALLPMSSIQEDGNLCTGPFPMAIVSEATVERPGLLDGLNLSGFQDALESNTNAGLLVQSANTSMLLGWHGGERLCGNKAYPSSTIYFVIKEPTPFRISLSKQGQNTSDLVTIPPFLRSLLIVAPNSNICFLADRSSAAGANPTVTTTNPDGTTVTTVITPSGEAAVSSSGGVPPEPSPESSESDPMPAESATPVPESVVTSTPDPTPPVVAMPESSPEGVYVPEASPELLASPESIFEQPGVIGETPMASPPGNRVDDDGDGDGTRACFPGSSLVDLASGERIHMSQLKLGDVVRTVYGDARVVLFTHQERKGTYAFVRLTTRSRRSLTVSPEHYLFSNGLLRIAKTVQLGDSLQLDDGREDVVEFIERVSAVGLYNPQTENGELIVDGIRVSAYTAAVHPRLAHNVLMPVVTAAYRCLPGVVAWFSRLLENGSPTMAGLLPGPDGLQV